MNNSGKHEIKVLKCRQDPVQNWVKKELDDGRKLSNFCRDLTESRSTRFQDLVPRAARAEKENTHKYNIKEE